MNNREEKIAALRELIKSDDEKFGIDKNWTIEQFQSDMEKASPDERESILIKGLDNFQDMNDPATKAAFLKWKDELELLRNK